MYLNEFIADALQGLEIDCGSSDGPQTFTWKGVEVPCVSNMLEKGTSVIVGGKEWTIQETLNVRKSNFLSADSTLITADSDLYTVDNGMRQPVAGVKLIFRGHTFKILTASEDPTRAYYKLTLVDANSGR
jgi:hypothetical protein